ncbi:site-specific tyrosine recombinase XerC [compost metagenome]
MLGLMGLSTISNEREREASKEELEAIFEAYSKMRRQQIPMIDIVTFAVASAMRQEEICSLKIPDVDFEGRTVVVRNRKDPKKKIGNNMIVPLLGKAWEIVEKHIGDRTDGRVFPFNHRSVGTSFGRICEKCQINDLHFHDLRHTAIGLLFELGLAIEQVAQVSGHREWKTLKRYTHVKAKNIHETYDENMEKRKVREKTLDVLT